MRLILALLLNLLLATAASAQAPSITYANPIAGFSMQVPYDWEEGGGVLGAVMVGLDGDMSLGFPSLQPVIWVFYAKTGPEATANNLKSPAGTTGAFSAPPASFNIAVPYTPAGQAARSIVLPALQQQYPGIRLDKVEELPRAGAYYRDGIRLLGLGNNPRVDKARADYLTTLNGVRVRIRVTIGTFMLDQSALLGGRGDWFLTSAGAWAPVNDFDAGYALGRGAMASLHTAPAWKRAQFRVAGAAADWAEYVREALGDWFDEEYLRGP